MTESLIRTFLLMLLWWLLPAVLCSQTVSESFEFQFEEKTLRGLIEKPAGKLSEAIIILVPGYGETDFVEGGWFSELREQLVSWGLTVCVWDKMGCGESDGEFNALQPVENSADEALAAIQEIKRLAVPGHEKIGLWGLSRAGWICPLINKQFPLDFWISVSGTDDKENFGYLLRSNLVIEGKTEAEADRLLAAWLLSHKLLCTEGSQEEYLKAFRPLMQDSICRKLFGYSKEADTSENGKQAYATSQNDYTLKGHYDAASGLWTYIEDFESILTGINCPVLALFGADDSQVDWRKTKKLYEQTIATNPNASLHTEVFVDCNHSLQKCITCGFQEDLSSLQWQACDGYYEAMENWLRSQYIIE